MPPKGYKTVTIPESLLIDLNLLQMEFRAKNPAQVIKKLYNYYRRGHI